MKYEVHFTQFGDWAIKPAPVRIAYRGDSLQEAQAAVREASNTASRVWTVRDGIRLDLYTSDKFQLGLCWDFHEDWLKNFHAGAFDEAYMRDYLNEDLARGRITSKQYDEQYAEFLQRRAGRSV